MPVTAAPRALREGPRGGRGVKIYLRPRTRGRAKPAEGGLRHTDEKVLVKPRKK